MIAKELAIEGCGWSGFVIRNASARCSTHCASVQRCTPQVAFEEESSTCLNCIASATFSGSGGGAGPGGGPRFPAGPAPADAISPRLPLAIEFDEKPVLSTYGHYGRLCVTDAAE